MHMRAALTWPCRNVVLFSPTTSKGVSIDYPTIALHALGSQDGQTAVYLQLDLHDQELTNDDDDIQTLTLHLIPKASVGESASNGHTDDTNGIPSANGAAAKDLFEALSACADLNPDPMDEDEDGEGPEVPEPGAGGWITSENMHEFMDENGNWTGPEIPVLGAGAGQVRPRDDEDADGDEAVEDAKWQRTG
jgi:nucleotide-sensitive chloride channel 1A